MYHQSLALSAQGWKLEGSVSELGRSEAYESASVKGNYGLAVVRPLRAVGPLTGTPRHSVSSDTLV